MEIVDEKLVLALKLFALRKAKASDLRAFLADWFFRDSPQSVIDRILIGEIEVSFAEYDRGDATLNHVRRVADELSSKALSLMHTAADIPVQDLVPALALM